MNFTEYLNDYSIFIVDFTEYLNDYSIFIVGSFGKFSANPKNQTIVSFKKMLTLVNNLEVGVHRGV